MQRSFVRVQTPFAPMCTQVTSATFLSAYSFAIAIPRGGILQYPSCCEIVGLRYLPTAKPTPNDPTATVKRTQTGISIISILARFFANYTIIMAHRSLKEFDHAGCEKDSGDYIEYDTDKYRLSRVALAVWDMDGRSVSHLVHEVLTLQVWVEMADFAAFVAGRLLMVRRLGYAKEQSGYGDDKTRLGIYDRNGLGTKEDREYETCNYKHVPSPFMFELIKPGKHSRGPLGFLFGRKNYTRGDRLSVSTSRKETA